MVFCISVQGFKMNLRIVRVFILVVFAAALSGQVYGQSDQGLESRVFGQGQPATIGDLPPGQLKRKINGLPAQAQGRALQWLQDFSFPAIDVEMLDVDSEGGIYYVETNVLEGGDEAAEALAKATVKDDAA